MSQSFLKDGKFFIGCNYWASHAGTNMWRDWRPEVIQRDFALLAEAKIQYLRVFPLWSDFQPIKMHRRGAGIPKEIRMGEEPLPFTEAGRAGVSQEMADRFEMLCDLARKYDLKLVVGLLTGWMSGRMHVPPLLEDMDVLRDPRAIKWQIKFVKYMVNRFKSHPAIVAWDLGNECNCMGQVRNSEEGYVWASAIAMAIQTRDRTRPVISGMHGSFPEAEFRAQDLGEILDVLCTHPYPLFTAHCMTDPITEQKSVLHAAAETVLYRGLSGKPAFVEEAGTHGPFIASEENAAAYLNTVLHLLWSHNCLGLMWWCGFDQLALKHTPYDWEAMERELGLFREDYGPKPVLREMTAFAEFTEKFPYEKLSPRIVDAVCILSAEGDTWLAAYGAFILAKQAGLDMEFCYISDEIPEARAYILPSIAHGNLPAHVLQEIFSRVEQGAILYLSMGDGMLSPFERYTGMKPLCRYKPLSSDRVQLGEERFTFRSNYKVDYEAADAKVLARDDGGRPVMGSYRYGKGTVYYLGYPLEDIAGSVPGVVSGTGFVPYYKFYQEMKELYHPDRKVAKDNPFVAHTEHMAEGKTRIVVAVNCVPRESHVRFVFEGCGYVRTLKNQGTRIESDKNCVNMIMAPNSTVVFEIMDESGEENRES